MTERNKDRQTHVRTIKYELIHSHSHSRLVLIPKPFTHSLLPNLNLQNPPPGIRPQHRQNCPQIVLRHNRVLGPDPGVARLVIVPVHAQLLDARWRRGGRLVLSHNCGSFDGRGQLQYCVVVYWVGKKKFYQSVESTNPPYCILFFFFLLLLVCSFLSSPFFSFSPAK